MKALSVIVPCYNVEKYIDQCAESLVNQTLGLADMEIIFVDDASTDHTLDHLKVWESRYPDDILVIACEENGKQGTARNIGMEYANGKYIGFVDSDDFAELNMYEMMLRKAEEYKCDMVHCYQYRDFEDGRRFRDALEKKDTFIEFEKATVEGGEWHGFLAEGGVYQNIYLREFLTSHDIRFPEGLFYEDNYFCMLAALYCKSFYKINHCLYHYRENSSSTTLMRNNERLYDRMDIEIMKVNKWKELGIFERFHEEIELNFFQLYYFNTLFMMATRCDSPSYEVFQRMEKEIMEYFPDYQENVKLADSGNALWNLLLKVLQSHFNEEQFLYFMKRYAELPRTEVTINYD